jgi:hypothetical protein
MDLSWLVVRYVLQGSFLACSLVCITVNVLESVMKWISQYSWNIAKVGVNNQSVDQSCKEDYFLWTISPTSKFKCTKGNNCSYIPDLNID